MELPRYRQVPLGCGLATVLMLFDPERNENLKIFLNELYQSIAFLIPRLALKFNQINEYKWAVSLDYILLKSLGDNPLSKFLKEILKDDFENHKLVTIFKLQGNKGKEIRRLPEKFSQLYDSYFNSYLLNPYILQRSLFNLRDNMDLKVLFALFGGKFFPQEQDNYDGTGSIYFTKDDFRTESADNKLKILRDHLTKNKNTNRIALNLGHHWVAVTSIEDNIISFNNPSSGKASKFKVNKKVPESYRFYLFSYDIDNAYILKEDVIHFIDSEIDKEFSQIKDFTKSLVEGFESEQAFQEILKENQQMAEATNPQTEDIEQKSLSEGETQTIVPLSGDELMKNIRKIIRSKFSDYSKL